MKLPKALFTLFILIIALGKGPAIADNLNLSNALTVHFPASDSVDFEAVRQTNEWRQTRQGWISEHFSDFNFWTGDTPKVVWLKLDLTQLELKSSEHYLVELASSGVSRATFFYFNANKWHSISSDELYQRAAKKDYSFEFTPQRFITFPVIKQWQTQPIYLKAVAPTKLHLQVNIDERTRLLARHSQTDAIFFFCYGILFVMALYNLVIGKYLHDSIYYYYSSAIFSTLIYQFFAHGHSRLFTFFNWDYINHLLNFFAMLSALTALIFLYYFANFRQHTPKLAEYFRSFLSFFGIVTFLTLVLPTNTSLNIALLVAGPTPIFAMALTIWAWYRGSKAAGVFVFAWSFYILGGFLWVLYWLGIVSLSNKVEMPLVAGAALESILLSLALGYRIQLMQKQRTKLKQSEKYYKTISELDPLTKLANRRAFDQHIATLHADKNAFSLVLLDIDHFKNYNDSYGHQAGDKVIQKLGLILQDTVRGEDLAARIGGEEFALIILNDNVEVARNIAERIRIKFSQTPFINDDKEVFTTVSIGISIVEENETTEQLIKRTDDALYRAKDKGRNQTQMSVKALAS